MPQASPIARDDETKCDVIPAGLRARWRVVDEDFPLSSSVYSSHPASLYRCASAPDLHWIPFSLKRDRKH